MRKLKLNTKKLRMEMDRQGLKYRELAKLMNCTYQAIGYYFANPGNLTLKTINKIARALGLDPKDLLI